MRGVVAWAILIVLNLTTPTVLSVGVLEEVPFLNSGWEFEWQKKGVVVDVGPPGDPDDISASSASVIYNDNMYKVWYSAYDGSVWRIMYADSPDGMAFTKHGVVLERGAPGDLDDDFLRDPRVLRNDQGIYEMWYTGQKKNLWGWRIFHATSNDGVNWQKHGKVFSKNGVAVAHSNVLIDANGVYRMWYSEYDKSNWRIRHATSTDGENWVDNGLVLDIGAPGSVDSKYIYAPSVIVEPNGTYVMFYSGTDGNPFNQVNLSFATSPDGMAGTWTKQGVTLERGQPGDPDSVQATGPSIVKGPDGLHRLYYMGYDGTYRRWMLALEVGQVPPVAELGSDSLIDEGDSVVIDATGSYDMDGEIVRYEYDFGDGTSFVYEPADGAPPLISHQYGDDGLGHDGVYTVTLTVIDDDGLTASDSMIVTVSNVIPTVYTRAPTQVYEGSLVTALIEVTDPGSDDLAVVVDWGDGSATTEIVNLNDPKIGPDPYPSPQIHPRLLTKSVHHVYGDNGIYILTITATDDDGGESTLSRPIDVVNLPPAMSVSQSGPISEGQDIILVVDVSDLGSDDISLDIGWGDVTTEKKTYYNNGVGPDPPRSPLGNHPFNIAESFLHTYGDNGIYTVAITATDDDGGEVTKWIDVEVMNLLPTISPFGPFAVDEGSPLTVSVTGQDPGSDDLIFQWLWESGPSYSHTYYNDGVGPDSYPSPFGTFPFSIQDSSSHTYGDDGNFTIALILEDDDGGVRVYQTYAIVNNVAPAIVLLNYTVAINTPRTIGYWGHQCEVTVPYGDHTGILPEWVDSISTQSQVFAGISTISDACKIMQNGGASDMIVMAKRQLMGNWLNIVSDKLHPMSGLNMPNLTSSATLWEALQEIEDIILGSLIRDELERVKNIADNVNNGIGIAKASVDFKATAVDPGSDDLTFTWDFGDGTAQVNFYPNDGSFPVEVTDSVSHSYFSSGSFAVTLTVEDDDGGTGTMTVNVVI